MKNLHFKYIAAQQPTDNAIPVILIHGLFGSLENLAGIAKAVSSTRNTYLIDLPNHARSAHTDKTSLAAMTIDVLNWMDAQKIQAADLVGHSLGGKVAMEIALTHPSRVNKLVVLDIAPAHYAPHHNQVFEGLNSIDCTTLTDRRAADAALMQYVPDSAVRSFLLKNLTKNKHDSSSAFTWKFNLPVLTRDYPHLIEANSDTRFDGEVLFIKGGRSDYINESYRHAIIKRFERVSVKIVENAGHWLHAEKPVIVSGIITRFLT